MPEQERDAPTIIEFRILGSLMLRIMSFEDSLPSEKSLNIPETGMSALPSVSAYKNIINKEIVNAESIKTFLDNN